MIFTFGKYKDYKVEHIVNSDRKYCEWLLKSIENKEEYKEMYSEIVKKLAEIKSEPENPQMMMFGKYDSIKIENFISSDKSYCEWLLRKESFKDEYPETYDYLKKCYDAVHRNATEIKYFFVLNFRETDYLKIGITKNFIVKRIYGYTQKVNNYEKDLIDYKSSFVYRTNDMEIQKKTLKNFNELTIDGRTKKIVTSVDDIDSFITKNENTSPDYFYTKKCLYDFIPFDNGTELEHSIDIKSNEFANFKEVYEDHLRRLNLRHKYNPEFIG